MRAEIGSGLVAPYRTQGGTRRYSAQDVERVLRIATLLAQGHNLAGIRRILELEAEVERLRAEVTTLRRRRRRG